MRAGRFVLMMRAFGFHAHGGLDNLQLVEVETPEPAAGEVRIRVAAAALNRLDLFVVKGWRGLDLPKPHIGGSDGAGVVDAVGEGVTDFVVGDRVVVYGSLSCGACADCARGEVSLCATHRVFGEHSRGALAEQAVVPAANLLKVPDDFPLENAAAASLTFLTAWRMLVTRARLRAGERVLVVGSAGGVNLAAIQIAQLAGAADVHVVATQPQKAVHARRFGASHVYASDAAWHKEALAATGGRGFDVVVDNVGEATWGKSLRAVARGGRIVTVGGTTGYGPSAEINQIMWKQIDILGSTMGTRAEFETVMALVFAGRLEAIVDSVFPLSDGAKAYERLASGQAVGKVIVRPT